MQNIFGVATVPAIVIITWIICAIVKLWLDKKDIQTKVIPTLAVVVGLILGYFAFGGYHNLDEVCTAMASGLAATGANELMKAFRKDTEVNA